MATSGKREHMCLRFETVNEDFKQQERLRCGSHDLQPEVWCSFLWHAFASLLCTAPDR